jgi:uncharacterized RDD family membrane protein YckC
MEMVQCSVCKKGFSEDAVIKMGDYRVCSECKPVFLQRLREGLSLSGDMTYGGFWVRFRAQFVDGIVIGVGSMIAAFLIGLALGVAGMGGWMMKVLSQLLLTGLGIAYVTYFLGAYGATLGKMVFGLRVVRPNGDKISYGRAFGRYWAYLLSSITFGIGYIMAGFDGEKRALHDRICDTRVIKA